MSAPLPLLAQRAIHAVNNAIQIATAFDEAEDVARIVELLSDVPTVIAELAQAYDDVLATNARLLAENIHLTKDLRGTVRQGVEDAREITDLKTRLAVASRDVEQLLQRASIRLQGETADFNSIRGLRDVLNPRYVDDVDDHGDFTILDTPRTAAGAH